VRNEENDGACQEARQESQQDDRRQGLAHEG
jgi:hypothetical protein